tara:strand:- start:470 stop:1276 length:807 start_codon:yes stop_codon:yes gene_type:complete
MNRSNIAELITSKYGTPSSQTGIRGVGSNEAYRAQVDSLLDQPTHRRAAGGGFLSQFMNYIKNWDPSAAQGEGFGADLGRQFSPSTMAMVEKTATPAAPVVTDPTLGIGYEGEAVLMPESPTITVTGTTATPTEEAEAPAESTALKAFKQITSGLSAEAIKHLIRKKVGESDDSFTPTHAGRSSQQNRGRNVSFNPIAGSGFKDGGRLLGRELYLGGGEINGPGGPKEDLVPVWASDDEYVVSAEAVERIGNGDHAAGISTLDRINFR